MSFSNTMDKDPNSDLKEKERNILELIMAVKVTQ